MGQNEKTWRNLTRQKKLENDRKVESNDSSEIPGRGKTSEAPGFLSSLV